MFNAYLRKKFQKKKKLIVTRPKNLLNNYANAGYEIGILIHFYKILEVFSFLGFSGYVLIVVKVL